MAVCAGIRREDKNEWERRVPITPEHVKELRDKHDLHFIVQPSPVRVFPDNEYVEAGALVSEDLSGCNAIFAVKEIPIKLLLPQKTYMFFSHVIKGQPYNMPMLKKLMELGCTLIDYEKVEDAKGRRLIFFGRHAGIAGAIESFHALGRRLELEGIKSPFSDIRHAYDYSDMKEITDSLKTVGSRISTEGLPREIAPVAIGIAGYGHVGGGASEIIDLLPNEEIKPSQLRELAASKDMRNDIIYKVVFKEEDLVTPVSKDADFILQEYYDHPEKYEGVFEQYLPHLTLLLNTIYWTNRYPRLVTKAALKKLYEQNDKPTLRVIGDISCDIEGAIEATAHSTNPGTPCFVYNPLEGKVSEGIEGKGVAIMAVDNLPCEIPAESSRNFSNVLKSFAPAIARADYSTSFEELELPPEIRKAVILHKGKLTPDFKYLEKNVKS